MNRDTITGIITALPFLALFIALLVCDAGDDPILGDEPTTEELARCTCEVAGQGRSGWLRFDEVVCSEAPPIRMGSRPWVACTAAGAEVESARRYLRESELEAQVVHEAEMRRMQAEVAP